MKMFDTSTAVFCAVAFVSASPGLASQVTTNTVHGPSLQAGLNTVHGPSLQAGLNTVHGPSLQAGLNTVHGPSKATCEADEAQFLGDATCK